MWKSNKILLALSKTSPTKNVEYKRESKNLPALITQVSYNKGANHFYVFDRNKDNVQKLYFSVLFL